MHAHRGNNFGAEEIDEMNFNFPSDLFILGHKNLTRCWVCMCVMVHSWTRRPIQNCPHTVQPNKNIIVETNHKKNEFHLAPQTTNELKKHINRTCVSVFFRFFVLSMGNARPFSRIISKFQQNIRLAKYRAKESQLFAAVAFFVSKIWLFCLCIASFLVLMLIGWWRCRIKCVVCKTFLVAMNTVVPSTSNVQVMPSFVYFCVCSYVVYVCVCVRLHTTEYECVRTCECVYLCSVSFPLCRRRFQCLRSFVFHTKSDQKL